MNAAPVILLLCCFFMSAGQTEKFSYQSKHVNDSFDITVTIKRNNKEDAFSSVVYYLDANLTSGKILNEFLNNFKFNRNILFVGIANRGKLHQFRKRDYIPPVLKRGDTLESKKANYGHADDFYEFLKNELIPLIEKKYGGAKQRTLLGHSYGGLFVLYSLLKPNQLFDNYLSFSPSVWVNNFNILKYENALSKKENNLNSYLYLSAGKKEVFNLILFGNRRLKKQLQNHNYKGLKLDYAEHKGKNHFSQLPVSIEYILQNDKY